MRRRFRRRPWSWSRVVAAEGVGLFVGAEGLFVFVALVGGDYYYGFDGGRPSYCVQDAGGADDVGLVGGDGVVV